MTDEVAQIKDRIDIVALIGQRVKLVRRGSGYLGLCPFHTDKHPSFYVYPTGRVPGGHYKCFACGEKGDAFTFLMKLDSLDFPTAKKTLAKLAGVELRSVDPRREARRARLFEVMEAAARFYREELARTPAALEYAHSRGFSDAGIERFELGYLGDGGGVQAALRAAGFSIEECIDAGVLGRSERGTVFERYRERLIFPVRDESGKLVTFGGRLIRASREDRHEPKYLNGPATDIFDKSAVLFGLYHARTAIPRTRTAVLVEGYMDVALCHQQGSANVIAPMGTAITPQHAQKLRRYADAIVIALDPDAGGQQGTRRGMETIRQSLVEMVGSEEKLSVTIKILTLPEGRDPDEIVLEDRERWESLVAGAKPVIDHLISQHAGLDRNDPKAKRRAADDILPYLRALTDPIAAKHYRDRLKSLLEIDDAVLAKLLAGSARSAAEPAPASAEAPAAEPVVRPPTPLELRVLHALLVHPDAYRRLVDGRLVPELDEQDFLHAGVRSVVDRVLAGASAPDLTSALDTLGDDHGPLLEVVYATTLPSGQRAYGELIYSLRRATLRREQDMATTALEAAVMGDDASAAQQADAEVQRVAAEMSKLQRGLAAFSDRPDAAL